MSLDMRDRAAGLAAMAGCALLWSTAGLLIKVLDWNAFAIAGGRSTVAAVFIFIWLKRPKFTLSFPQIGAALAHTATMLLFVYANKHTTSANAILLQYGAPIYTAFLGYLLLGEKIRLEHFIALICVGGGMVLLLKDDLAGMSPAGDIAAIVSGVTFALYFIFMRMQKGGSPLESSLIAHTLTALIAFAVASFLPVPHIDVKSIAVIIILGVFQIGIASILLSYGIVRVSAIQGMIVAGLEPVFNPVWVFLATGELPGPSGLAGGIVILAAVTVSSIITARRKVS